MMRSLLVLLLLGLATVLPACSLLDGGDDALAGSVRVTADGSAIAIRNGTDQRIYYAAFASGVLPYINWGQHLDDEGPSLAPGQRADLTAGDIWRYVEADPEVVVFWWRAEVRKGERVPTEPESVVVAL